MRNALEAILKQLEGIAYYELSRAEKNILRTTCVALKVTWKDDPLRGIKIVKKPSTIVRERTR